MGIRVLAVPQWSFGRDRVLLSNLREILVGSHCKEHFAKSYIDHNRTVTAFSGSFDSVSAAIFKMAEVCLPSIDLNRHAGSHPRIGALDVCPFVFLSDAGNSSSEIQLQLLVNDFAKKFAASFETPVYLYEKSQQAGVESELPRLRKGGFGSLGGRKRSPDFGPEVAHKEWGVATIGIRDFLICGAVNLNNDEGSISRRIVRQIRYARMDGDERFMGVRTMALPLPTLNQMQVKFDLTMPNSTNFDHIVNYILRDATSNGATLANTELIGVIRRQDLATATRVLVEESQIVEEVI